MSQKTRPISRPGIITYLSYDRKSLQVLTYLTSFHLWLSDTLSTNLQLQLDHKQLLKELILYQTKNQLN
jgi:hypothetical protein